MVCAVVKAARLKKMIIYKRRMLLKNRKRCMKNLPRTLKKDISKPGQYFVSICTQTKMDYFGQIIDGEVVLNAAGAMVKKVWLEMMDLFPGLYIKDVQLMPDQIHSIVEIADNEGESYSVSIDLDQLLRGKKPKMDIRPVDPDLSLTEIANRFKFLTIKKYREGVKKKAWMPFYKELWQDNHRERFIKEGYESLEDQLNDDIPKLSLAAMRK